MSRRAVLTVIVVVLLTTAAAAAALLSRSGGGSPRPDPGASSTAHTSRSPAPSPSLPAGDIRRYGARPDDGDDDTAAVVRALAANRRVTVPAGRFDLGSVTIPAGRTVEGTGWESWLRGDITLGGDRITLKDLTLGKPGNNVEQARRTDDFLALGVRFRGGGQWLEPGGAPGPEGHVVAFDGPGGDRIRFVSCYFERSRNWVSDTVSFVDQGGVDGASYTNVLFKDCTFEPASFMALEFIQRPPYDSATGRRRPNLRGYSITVTGCTFEGADSQVVSFDSNPTPGGPYDRVEFSHNTVGPGGQDPSQPYPHGIEVNNGVAAWVHHNTVAGSRGFMVNADSPEKGDAAQLWEHNTFDQNAGLAPQRDAIVLAADHVTFRRNVVVFAGAPERHVFYITGDRVRLAGNDVTADQGLGALAYLDGALGTVFADNVFRGPGRQVVLVDGATLLSWGNTYETGVALPFAADAAARLRRRDDTYR